MELFLSLCTFFGQQQTFIINCFWNYWLNSGHKFFCWMAYNREIVRRKAVLCLCSFLRKMPDMALEIRPLVHRSLGDRDPGVVRAAVEVYQQLAIVGFCLQFIMLRSSSTHTHAWTHACTPVILTAIFPCRTYPYWWTTLCWITINYT